jgi:hypothetical protein
MGRYDLGQRRDRREANYGAKPARALAGNGMKPYRLVSIIRDISSVIVTMGGTMADNNLLLLARDMRARAEEILAKAETMQDADARQLMHEIAERYEKLAERLENDAN